MSRFLFRLGQSSARHRWRVVAVWLIVAVAVIGARGSAGGSFNDNFKIPHSQSQQARDTLATRFPAASGALGRVVFHSSTTRLDAPAAEQTIEHAIQRIAADRNVVTVTDPFSPGGSTLSRNGRTAFADVQYREDTVAKSSYRNAAAAAKDASRAGVETELSSVIVGSPDGKPTGNEMLGLLIAVVILLVALGSIVAMGVPIGTAVFGIMIGLSAVAVFASRVAVPSIAPVLATMVGLGVGIDYALFVVTRFREERGHGLSVPDAAGAANSTAGRVVLFAGATVVMAILGLSLAGLPSVAAIGAATGIVVVVAMVAAVTLLPALLGVAGPRMDRSTLRRSSPRRDPRRTPLSARWAARVGRRPWPYAAAGVAVLVLLAVPVFSLRLGMPDDGTAPASSTQHKAYDLLSSAYGKGFNGPLLIVATTPAGTTAWQLQPLTSALASTPGIAAVEPPKLNPEGNAAVIVATPTTSPQDQATVNLVRQLRAKILPRALAGTGMTAAVGGQTAVFIDLSSRVGDRLPIFIAAVIGLSFLLLLMVFRSIAIPLKAAAMNLLSVGAAYGVITAVFQWGWAKDLIGLKGTEPINPFVPLVMFAVLFGLSMDYEVFLLSRMRERYLAHGDSRRSVVEGLGSTARVITSAALIMIAIFASFVAGQGGIKMFGLGLATAVLLDVTLIRMVLVPATMSILGDANWWLPRWLDRLLPRFDLEGPPEAPAFERQSEPERIEQTV